MKKETGIRLEKIYIENFKIIDSLEMEFPKPLLDDPDIFVLGSKNGYGKTSVLQAICLILTSITNSPVLFPALFNILDSEDKQNQNIQSNLIQAGQKQAKLLHTLSCNNNTLKTIEIQIQKDETENTKLKFVPEFFDWKKLHHQSYRMKHKFYKLDFYRSLLGINPNPIMSPPIIYFNSYRKISEGSIDLNQSIEKPMSSLFKQEIIELMMSKAGLFDNYQEDSAEKDLNKLNDLMKGFAGGKVEKLRHSPDNTIDLTITKENDQTSFSFDGLSSGQKEIISTLFLIWKYTKDFPSIVLIDEPELHLNAEWQVRFMRKLKTIAPQNQYILATHSEHIFGYVEEYQRALISFGEEN